MFFKFLKNEKIENWKNVFLKNVFKFLKNEKIENWKNVFLKNVFQIFKKWKKLKMYFLDLFLEHKNWKCIF